MAALQRAPNPRTHDVYGSRWRDAQKERRLLVVNLTGEPYPVGSLRPREVVARICGHNAIVHFSWDSPVVVGPDTARRRFFVAFRSQHLALTLLAELGGLQHEGRTWDVGLRRTGRPARIFGCRPSNVNPRQPMNQIVPVTQAPAHPSLQHPAPLNAAAQVGPPATRPMPQQVVQMPVSFFNDTYSEPPSPTAETFRDQLSRLIERSQPVSQASPRISTQASANSIDSAPSTASPSETAPPPTAQLLRKPEEANQSTRLTEPVPRQIVHGDVELPHEDSRFPGDTLMDGFHPSACVEPAREHYRSINHFFAARRLHDGSFVMAERLTRDQALGDEGQTFVEPAFVPRQAQSPPVPGQRTAHLPGQEPVLAGVHRTWAIDGRRVDEAVAMRLNDMSQWTDDGWVIFRMPADPRDGTTQYRDTRPYQPVVDSVGNNFPHRYANLERPRAILGAWRANYPPTPLPHGALSGDPNLPQDNNISYSADFITAAEASADPRVANSRGLSPRYPRPAGVRLGWGQYDDFDHWQSAGRSIRSEMLDFETDGPVYTNPGLRQFVTDSGNVVPRGRRSTQSSPAKPQQFEEGQSS